MRRHEAWVMLMPCAEPTCDVVWLLEDRGETFYDIEAFWKRHIKEQGHAKVCKPCYARVIAMHRRNLAHTLLKRAANPADGPRGVGMDQPQAPSPPDTTPTWLN